MTSKMPMQLCLRCGTELETATGFANKLAQPKPDDPTICHLCGHLMQFNADLTLRSTSPEELAAFPEALQTDIKRAQMAVAISGIMLKLKNDYGFPLREPNDPESHNDKTQ